MAEILGYSERLIAPAGRNKYGTYYSPGNVTKSVINTTYGGNNTTTTIGDTGTTGGGGGGQENIAFYCMFLQPSTAFTEHDLDQEVCAATRVIAYRGFASAPTLVCDLESASATVVSGIVQDITIPVNSGIVAPTGVQVGVTDNGTSAATFFVKMSSDFTEDSGSCFVPVVVYKRDTAIPVGDDIYDWWDSMEDCEQVWLEFAWTVTRASSASGATGPSGESAWYLSLSNDNASVNCDANGNVLSGAVKPSCQARLYYGSTRNSGATYAIDYGSATGVTSSVTNGILTICTSANTFNFTGSTLAISVSGISSGVVKDVKTMNITKSLPGTNGQTPYISGGTWWIGNTDTGIKAEGDSGCTPYISGGTWWICDTDTGVKAEGEDAVSYWLETSYSSIIYNPNNQLPNPPAITVTGYRQIGQGPVCAVTSADGASYEYTFHKRTVNSFEPVSSYTTAITVSSADCVSHDRIRVIMKIGQAQVDQEDVDILMDGLNGASGESRQGPAIRGPYDYADVSASTRCWCAGESSSTCDDCDKWLDVVMCGDTYYYCNTTYYGQLSSHFPGYWTSGDSFDFVATKVLLASAASINFLTNNWLYLRDENGNIVGGARGSSAGTIFWAGSEDPDDGDTPFRVDLEGNIYAQKGIFAGYIQYPYTFVSELNYTNGKYHADGHAYLVSDIYNTGTYEPVDLLLPAPTSEWNGFTYDIIVEPTLSYSEGVQQLHTTVSGGSEIYCYAFSEFKQSSAVTLTCGRYQITCMPKRTGPTQPKTAWTYNWAITQATGGVIVHGTKDENMVNLLGESHDNVTVVNKVFTYSGNTAPSVPSTGNTMYVKL